MRYLTDRKRATGLGSAKSGVHHYISMKISSYALLILVPLFILTVAPMLGEPHSLVVAHFERPFPAIVAALTIGVGFMHFKNGVQVMIEDYFKGPVKDALLIGSICLSYGAAATGIFAIARLAL